MYCNWNVKMNMIFFQEGNYGLLSFYVSRGEYTISRTMQKVVRIQKFWNIFLSKFNSKIFEFLQLFALFAKWSYIVLMILLIE